VSVSASHALGILALLQDLEHDVLASLLFINAINLKVLTVYNGDMVLITQRKQLKSKVILLFKCCCVALSGT